ncbi:MAG: hypothetical protein KIS81_01105 [Maricaulaceae bacterium]|nr:hypothetical protein [Maricaulaceae bacterium]
MDLYAKRTELRAVISKARADLKAIEAAIRVFDAPAPRRVLFQRGHLQRLVFDAMRQGAQDNAEITDYVMTAMGWDASDKALFADIRVRVKDVTKRIARW